MAAEEEPEIIRRLDLLIGVVSLAFDDAIRAARERARQDPVVASILDRATDGWIASGDLRAAVSQECGVAERTVNRRMAELVAKRVLLQRGAAQSTAYRSSGLL